MKMAIENTFAMIKPEGIIKGIVNNIEAKIISSGLEIVDKKRLILDDNQFELLYGRVKHRQPFIYESLKDHMTSNPVVMMKIRGEDAIARVLEMRGNSNPKDAQPGTIRGDYAKDQDYAELYNK